MNGYRAWLRIAALSLVLTLCGCIEETIAVKVNKDGSGTLLLRVLLSKQGMAQVEAAASVLAGGRAGVAIYDKERMRNAAAVFGQGVTFKRGKEISRGDWKGYLVEYEFANINAIRLPGMVDPNRALTGGIGDSGQQGYTFQFKPGDDATLAIVPSFGAKPAAPAAGDAPPEGAPAGMPDPGMGMDGMGMPDPGMGMDGMGMPGPGMDGGAAPQAALPPGEEMTPEAKAMFQGMRAVCHIVVNGRITDTNSNFRKRQNRNSITLFDFDFDKLAEANSANFQHVQDKKSLVALADLASHKIAGAVAENPAKTITITFR